MRIRGGTKHFHRICTISVPVDEMRGVVLWFFTMSYLSHLSMHKKKQDQPQTKKVELRTETIKIKTPISLEHVQATPTTNDLQVAAGDRGGGEISSFHDV